MLTELSVRNYALIDSLTIEFGPGLNVLTGETGAGKSIILGALSLVLGERADSSVVRTGETEVQVQARFEGVPPTAGDTLGDLGIDAADGALILRRRHDLSGKSAAHANDTAITVNALRRLGDRLVDLHGQHQHQLLLRPEVHLDILDQYGRLGDEREQFGRAHARLAAMRAELAALEGELAERRTRRDLTEYQARELADARIRPGEIGELCREQELLATAQKRYALARELEGVLSEREGSVAELLGAAAKRLAELAGIDPALGRHRETLTDARSRLDDLWRELVSYRESIQFSPERAEEVNARLFLLEKLEKKYRVAADELPGLAERLNQELGSIGFDETKREELRAGIAGLEKDLLGRARTLSGKRRRAASRLEARLGPEFAALGLEKARFSAPVLCPESPTADSLTASGFDTVEFLFSANPGEELRPLRKVASGGELSRIMLGLKNVLSGVEVVPTMVFDEVDVGIGGKVAEAVGRRLARLGQHQQVVCITHLPQIARYADHHFVVSKETSKGRTRTVIKRLDAAERVSELARMIAGERVTETSRAHARELLDRKAGD